MSKPSGMGTGWPVIERERGMTDGCRHYRKHGTVPKFQHVHGSDAYRGGVVFGAKCAKVAKEGSLR